MTHHIAVAQRGGHALRHHRGNGRSRHAPIENKDAEEVEYDVEHGGEQQEPERRLAVAQGTDDAGQQVVEERAGNADERDEQIPVSPLVDVVRRTHPAQDVAAEHTRQCGQDHRHDARQLQADGHVTAHGGIVPRPELLRHGDAEAAATPVAEP